MSEESFEPIRFSPPAGGLVFVCDHASNRLPEDYGSLGLDAAVLETHIAYDIGAATVTRALAKAYRAPAILARWSRLLIDLNRGPDDPTLIVKLSDCRVIPGNRHVGEDETLRRLTRFHAPYHAAVRREINRALDAGIVPTILSIHSFTPQWKGTPRPWEIGVLWDRDDRLAKPLLAALKGAGFHAGNNEPYSGELENDCLYRHGSTNGLPHALVEIRQDLIADEAQALSLAARLKPILDAAMTSAPKPHIRFFRPLTSSNGETTMDEQTRLELEAATFRRLVAHLRARTDVQNIELMTTAGFCRNCLGDWYREAAAEKGIALGRDEAREIIYGMKPSEWKARYQKEATPEQQAAFERAQKNDSHG